jgi:hypothetical protein
MSSKFFSRREFLKLASLSLAALAARRPDLAHAGRRLAKFPQALSDEQQRRLAGASLHFLAPDDASADEMARSIEFIEGRNEDASTMCGPLAIAILQEAELLGVWAKRHDFWLLNPRQNLKPVEYTFAKEKYEWYLYDTPISKFDFAAWPLMAGDLVYLHAGSGDTFEHVLVVNRVDEDGRAFSVTNFFTQDGTIIKERALYDPAVPGEGQFAAWANRDIRNTLGNTGSGGFRVWRVRNARNLELPSAEAETSLRAKLNELLLASNGSWFGAIKKISGPLIWEFNPYEPFHPASTIKIPVALAFYRWLEEHHPDDWQTYIAENGIDRTYAQLLRAMIVESEEEATQELVGFLKPAKLDERWAYWGLKSTHADPRRSSATDILTALDGLYRGWWIRLESRAHLLDLMATYTVNDDTRLGRLRSTLPAGSAIYNKRGSLVEWPTVVGDSAIIQLGSQKRGYVVTLHGVGKDAAGYEELEAVLDEAVDAVGVFLKNAT